MDRNHHVQDEAQGEGSCQEQRPAFDLKKLKATLPALRIRTPRSRAQPWIQVSRLPEVQSTRRALPRQRTLTFDDWTGQLVAPPELRSPQR